MANTKVQVDIPAIDTKVAITNLKVVEADEDPNIDVVVENPNVDVEVETPNTDIKLNEPALTLSWMKEVPVGLINGARVDFELSQEPAANSLFLFLNGQYIVEGTDYTLAVTTITYAVAPRAGMQHNAQFQV